MNESPRIPVAVVGATGYTGAELLRLLAVHPALAVRDVSARKDAGAHIAKVFPHFTGVYDLTVQEFDAARVAGSCKAAFLALPHAAAQDVAAALVDRGVRVVDLSADFRLRDLAAYKAWYGEHRFPQLVERAVYGLPELHRARIRGAELVAVPGCYPTATVLAAWPALASGLARKDRALIADCKSGASGAGRGASVGSLFCEVGEGTSAYKIAAHRHTPEMEQELGVPVTFSPHLVPMSRGILATVYLDAAGDPDPERVHAEYVKAYTSEPFVRVLPLGQLPSTAHVRGSNACHVGLAFDRRAQRIVAVAAIDNLTKGAAGAAVQCLNLALGLEETAGLLQAPLFP
jgi:N-acetyl-gamma-glutamyl-phosphate reductase